MLQGHRTTLVCALMLAALAPFPSTIQAQDAPKVTIAAAYTQEITREASYIGKGEAVDKVDLVARISGFLIQAAVADGTAVEEGSLLFSIEPDAYEAALLSRQAELAAAQAELDLAKIDIERKQTLLEREAISEAERDISLANEKVAEANVQAAEAAVQKAELDLSYTNITAPFPGRLGRIGHSIGDIVGPSSAPLATLVRQSPIYVTFSLTERQFVNVLSITEANPDNVTNSEMSPEVFVDLPNGTELDEIGRIVFVDNRIDPATGAISLRAEFENAEGLILDGSFVNLRIQALEPDIKTLIPQAAVQRDQRGSFVLVVNNQQIVEQRYVTLGQTVDAAFVVEDGLQEGTAVIVEGLQRVRPGVPVDAVLAGTPEE